MNGSGASPCSSRTSRELRALAVGQRHQVEQFLEQMARRLVGRADQQLLELAVDAREQLLARLARQQLAIDDRLDRRGADPAQPRTGHPAVQAVEARQRAAHQLEAGIEVLFADQAEQADLVHVAHPPAFLAQFGFGRQVVDGGARRPRDIQAGAEEEAFRQRRLPCGTAHFVDRRQEQLGDLLAIGLDVLQVAAQHVQGVAQGCQLAVALSLTPVGMSVASCRASWASSSAPASSIRLRVPRICCRHSTACCSRLPFCRSAMNCSRPCSACSMVANNSSRTRLRDVAPVTIGLVRLPRKNIQRHQSANSGFCLAICAAIATRRSADWSMAAFQVATYSRPSSTRWSRI